MRPIGVAVLGTALALLATGPLAAQEANRNQRSGFYVGFGLGYGALSVEGADGTEGGVSGMLRIGGTLSPKLLIGAETNGWTKSIGGTTVTFGTLTGAVQFYPSLSTPIFLNGGIGIATYAVEDFDAEYGLGVVLGLGYDARVGTNISITPFLNGYASSIEGFTVAVGQIGVGVTFH